ncbi:hypothetical protein JJB11_09830 [Ramlibacter ginsenosidimutans]|uniref:Uncharacterized protein n=1 Tax=Ramlibacter ginsenosidimutans TaxID=502333 RepID=A0A934TS90_9BURK|nr:hypothetical protein [Ramlibacter ginsenosidimutans]MBK6006390.1 hypothetical protein [Ramlibacter ginsenosidimutans]
MSSPARILVADHADAFDVFRQVLAVPHDLEHAASFDEAVRALRSPPSLLVCGCHFDEGRIFDLLRALKKDPACQGVPFLAVRCLRGHTTLDDTLYEGVKIAVDALGGQGFADVLWWQQQFGAEEASRRLRAVVDKLLQASRGS